MFMFFISIYIFSAVLNLNINIWKLASETDTRKDDFVVIASLILASAAGFAGRLTGMIWRFKLADIAFFGNMVWAIMEVATVLWAVYSTVLIIASEGGFSAALELIELRGIGKTVFVVISFSLVMGILIYLSVYYAGV